MLPQPNGFSRCAQKLIEIIVTKGMRVLAKETGEGILIKPITPIEDLAGIDAGKMKLREMRKKLDNRARDRY